MSSRLKQTSSSRLVGAKVCEISVVRRTYLNVLMVTPNIVLVVAPSIIPLIEIKSVINLGASFERTGKFVVGKYVAASLATPFVKDTLIQCFNFFAVNSKRLIF